MKKMEKIIQSTLATIIALASLNPALAAPDQVSDGERCYGIVKAGMNDCAAGNQSCAGSSVTDRQHDAFIFLPKGLCNKIVGGSLSDKG